MRFDGGMSLRWKRNGAILSDYSPKNGLSDDEVKKASARRTRRSFLVAGLGAIGGY